jgi:hypothetical protein
MNYETKFCRLCLKLSPPTILTSSLPFYPYQKDRRALPGYLLTRCSFFPLRYKAPLAFPQMCSLFFYSYTILSDSLSLRLQTVNHPMLYSLSCASIVVALGNHELTNIIVFMHIPSALLNVYYRFKFIVG